MTDLVKSTAVVLLLGTSILLSCGGKAESGFQGSNAGGKASDPGGAGAGPAAHFTECEALCARTTDAGCSAGDSACAMLCATVTGFGACQSKIQAWLDCARLAEVACDSGGVPTFVGCDTKLMLAAACAATAPQPKAVAAACGSYCDQLDAAGCAATTPIGDCRQACGLAGMVIANCQSNFIKYVNCAVASAQSCDESGQPNAAICTAQQLVYTGCVLTAVGDAAITAGSGGTAAE